MRIACESALRDSNTLSPSQIGQARRRLMSSTRSFGERGPASRAAPTASSPPTTSTSSTQLGQLFSDRSSSVRLAELLQFDRQRVGGDRRGVRTTTTPDGSMIQVSGTLATPNAVAIAPSSSFTIGQSPPFSANHLATASSGSSLITVYSSAPSAIVGLLRGERDQLGVLGLARQAGRLEEVEHHPAALAAAEVERLAVERRADHRRRRACRAGTTRRRRASRPCRWRARRTAPPARRRRPTR